jgi:hypothetical protein
MQDSFNNRLTKYFNDLLLNLVKNKGRKLLKDEVDRKLFS